MSPGTSSMPHSPSMIYQAMGSPSAVEAFPFLMNAEKATRELFVGNIPPNTPDQLLVQFLNGAMQRTQLCMANHNPVTNCRLSKNYAFIECATPEDANKALNLNCIPFMGTMLRVSRPSNYIGPHVQSITWQELTGQPVPSNLVSVIDSSPIPDKLNRELFIGNISPETTERDLIEFIGGAMVKVGLNTHQGNPVVSCRLKDKFAFVEFRSTEEASNALNLNNIPYNGTQLRVGRPAKYSGPQTNHGSWDDILAKVLSGELQIRLHETTEAATIMNNRKPSRIVELQNMLTAGDIKYDEDYNDILEETKEVCGQFGPLKNVVIPRSDPGMGKIFLEYLTVHDSTNALQGLAGRSFDGRIVVTGYFDEDKFMRHDFSDDQKSGNWHCDAERYCFNPTAA